MSSEFHTQPHNHHGCNLTMFVKKDVRGDRGAKPLIEIQTN